MSGSKKNLLPVLLLSVTIFLEEERKGTDMFPVQGAETGILIMAFCASILNTGIVETQKAVKPKTLG